MEPLTALSLASSIAQLLDFSAKVLRQAKSTASDQHTEISPRQIGEMASDLMQVAKSLRADLSTRTSRKPTQEEQDLCNLARQCNIGAAELITVLQKVFNIKPDRSRWDNLRQAFLKGWHEEAIDKLRRKLEEYRSQLTLRVLLVLNASFRAHDAKLDQLQNGRKEIVEVVSLNYQNLSSQMQRQHAETVAAIFTARDGTTSSLISNQGTQYLNRPGLYGSSTTYGQLNELSEFRSPSDFVTRLGIDHVRVVLNSLHFRGITERRGTILDAHKDTFEWVWQDRSHDEEAQWDDLKGWLEQGSGCYWLSGKAGSGKSSLMKYLEEDSRTMASLKLWSGATELITPSFYFWYAGSELQKSQIGLLRSLLHDILSRRSDLCHVLFPDVCRSILSGKLRGQSLELTHAEIKSAFSKLMSLLPKDVRIFFFVDGLDEYSGNHNEICDLFSQVTQSESIKILLSSRPIPVCVEKFSTSPMLRLQDLTKRDINKYSWDKLGSNATLKGMESVEPGVTAQLIDSIMSKACGVFLWVVLVVQRLINSLQNYETMEELAKEIDRLPSDLEQLYEHMLGSQKPEHRVLGSKYLQLVLRSMEMGIDLYLLQLSYAEGDDYKAAALKCPIQALSSEAEAWRCQFTEGRLRSRCCGLIETRPVVHAWYSRDAARANPDKKVEFFHRTVVEFLQLENIWKELTSLTAESQFHPDQALISSAISEFKAAPLQSVANPGQEQNPLLWRLFRMLEYQRHFGTDTREESRQLYMHEFKRVIQSYWHDPSLFASPDEEFEAIKLSAGSTARRLKLTFDEEFALSCLMRTPVDDLYGQFARDRRTRITPAHMLLHFIDEKDPRIRLSMAHRVPLNQSSTYCPETDGEFYADEVLFDVWKDTWREMSDDDLDEPLLHNMWDHMLYYIFTVSEVPQSAESKIVMSSGDMMVSLLDMILAMVHQDGRLVMAAHPNISITVTRMINSTEQPEEVRDITLIATLLWQLWSKASSSATLRNTGVLEEIAVRSCEFEDLISRQRDHQDLFISTLQHLNAEARQISAVNNTPAKKAVVTEKKSGFRRLLGLGKKKKVSEGDKIQHSPEIYRTRVASTISESPWRLHVAQNGG
ncbi:hypothetical protein DL770_004869 [Monosporascus sp. CRB-9-2]|nr:hypothetical protein DL770_004869 [Monosporascus sp. CRB-9-2]